MQTTPITPNRLKTSVIAVPPLARDQDLNVVVESNRAIVRYIENGGVDILLYGGNANFYHISLSEYGSVLTILAEIGAADTFVIPSIGPSYGTFMDQVKVLSDFDFPTVMALPQAEVRTSAGIATGLRHFADKFGKPIVLYLKHDNYMSPDDVASLVEDGLVSFIKYAVVREDPGNDPYLDAVCSVVDPNIIVSGIGEQPAIVHARDFGLAGFTSGCVCVAPRLSMKMFNAVQQRDFEKADQIREIFRPLEDLRNAINPIRVLHEAVALAGIAETGPMLPFLSAIPESDRSKIKHAAKVLRSV